MKIDIAEFIKFVDMLEVRQIMNCFTLSHFLCRSLEIYPN